MSDIFVFETLPTPDVPRLRKTLEHIEAHPDEWFQDYYAVDMDLAHKSRFSMSSLAETDHPVTMCGTACCFAGQVVSDAGYRFAFRPDEVTTLHCVDPRTGHAVQISHAARELLGITSSEACSLFDGDNTLEDLRQIVGLIAERAGEKL